MEVILCFVILGLVIHIIDLRDQRRVLEDQIIDHQKYLTPSREYTVDMIVRAAEDIALGRFPRVNR